MLSYLYFQLSHHLLAVEHHEVDVSKKLNDPFLQKRFHVQLVDRVVVHNF